MFSSASRGRRFLAYLIDAIIVGLVVGGIFWLIGFDKVFSDYVSNSRDISGKIEFLGWKNKLNWSSFLVYCIYCSVMEGSKLQATLGKRIMGIRVIKDDGEDLTMATSLIRNMFKIISYIPCSLGFIWILFSSEKKGWHDYIAKTVVIDD
ncbi:Uncharacterized membrane protein YckC, RDD family [Clostridium cavendishii DSM 21758]|uniref:Uncharacterized membrane protein YckC, RDD family n=1 Tax=Clostridium cavendishii DSM 21758 TaxID=1121302 RepID=A0A1M6QYA3_9CLOT|nr:RDD family protein [Clostridium cavendishii]SHK25239.1 Uncharacterized membrane protein YckC, RDD family [Clostridium cavendishii DSM 21758]